MIVHVAPEARDATMHETSLPRLTHPPALADIPVIAKDPGAGIESVTVTLSASDGPSFVTVIV